MRTSESGIDRKYLLTPAALIDLRRLDSFLSKDELLTTIDINLSSRRKIYDDINNLFEIEVTDCVFATLVCNDNMSKIAIIAISTKYEDDMQMPDVSLYADIIRIIANIISLLN